MARTHRTSHTVSIAAPASDVYDLIADVSQWPTFLTPTIHAERVDRNDTQERIRLWALANGEVRTWTSLRRLHRGALTVEFRQEVSQPPVASMSGRWTLTPRSERETVAELTHEFASIGDDPAAAEWIQRAVDSNSDAELDCLRRAAERRHELPDLVLTFEDRVRIDAPAADVYDFLYRCDRWPDLVPHVASVDLQEPAPGHQLLEMGTRGADGAVHTTSSVRVCFPARRIVYKQTRFPPIMSAHVGEWRLLDAAQGVDVVARHAVVIDADAVPEWLGPGVTVAQARECIHEVLSANSTRTLEQAELHADAPASS